jgi:hypothetical protein
MHPLSSDNNANTRAAVVVVAADVSSRNVGVVCGLAQRSPHHGDGHGTVYEYPVAYRSLRFLSVNVCKETCLDSLHPAVLFQVGYVIEKFIFRYVAARCASSVIAGFRLLIEGFSRGSPWRREEAGVAYAVMAQAFARAAWRHNANAVDQTSVLSVTPRRAKEAVCPDWPGLNSHNWKRAGGGSRKFTRSLPSKHSVTTAVMRALPPGTRYQYCEVFKVGDVVLGDLALGGLLSDASAGRVEHMADAVSVLVGGLVVPEHPKPL